MTNAANRLMDISVVAICLSGVLFFGTWFLRDLRRTIEYTGDEPVGIVLSKTNTVQRRLANRMIWNRLDANSFVYSGDRINVAARSEATLTIEDKHITLNENTLIRVQAGDGGPPRFELYQGDLNITTGSGGGPLYLTINNRQVEIPPNSALNAAVLERGMMLQVYEGDTVIFDGMEQKEVSAGKAMILDASGAELLEPIAVVTEPRPNARFLNSRQAPLAVAFAWTRFNFEDDAELELVIAEDRAFTRIARALTGLDAAETTLDNGNWYWRLSSGGMLLSDGRITVTNAIGPVLYSPESDQQFSYRTRQPELRFRWEEVAGASYYVLKAGSEMDLAHPRIEIQVWGTSVINSELGAGTWYWQVEPVFPSDYIGRPGVSSPSSFRIAQNGRLNVPVLKAPPENSTVDIAASRGRVYLSWESEREAATATVQIASDSQLSDVLVSHTTRDNYFVYEWDPAIGDPGEYYWQVFFNNDAGEMSPLSPVHSFTVSMPIEARPTEASPLPERSAQVAQTEAQESLAAEASAEGPETSSEDPAFVAGELPTEDNSAALVPSDPVSADTVPASVVAEVVVPEKVPAQPVALVSPAQGVALPGLRALREPTIFRWSSAEPVGRSRFVLSQNSNPLQGQPVRDIQNPSMEISMDRLTEGIWYWTIVAQTPEGEDISAAAPRQLRVLPIPTLGVAVGLAPEDGSFIDEEELRVQRQIIFSWSDVPGANAYIITIFEERDGTRRQITTNTVFERTIWAFSNLNLLSQGSFVWQIEAVNTNQSGVVEQRGELGENTFYIDFTPPSQIEFGDVEVIRAQ